MSYGLRGLDGRIYGLGLAAPVKPVPEDCGVVTSINNPCVLRNQAAGEKYGKDLADYMASLGFNISYTDNYVPQVYAPVYTPSPAAPTAVAARGGQLSFSSSRGSNALKVGDTWLVSITGASPNTQVSVQGTGPGGPFSSAMGTTDGAGNFSKSGSVGAGEVGSWSENWSVGSALSGAVSFSVSPVATTSNLPIGGAAPAGGLPVGGAPAGGAPAGLPLADETSGFTLPDIPWWGWAVGLGAAVFAFGGGRGR